MSVTVIAVSGLTVAPVDTEAVPGIEKMGRDVRCRFRVELFKINSDGVQLSQRGV